MTLFKTEGETGVRSKHLPLEYWNNIYTSNMSELNSYLIRTSVRIFIGVLSILAAASTSSTNTHTYIDVEKVVPGAVSCPIGWVLYKEKERCFGFFHNKLTRKYASKFCSHHGSHLVTIADEETVDFLKNNGNWSSPYWIGLRILNITENLWYWPGKKNTPQSLQNFNHWDEHEPSGTDGDCVVANEDGLWETKICWNNFNWFICENGPSRTFQRTQYSCIKSYWKLYEEDKTCYHALSYNYQWDQGRSYCEMQGGDLAKIKSYEAEKFIRLNVLGNYSYWIGLRQDMVTGKYHWLDEQQEFPENHTIVINTVGGLAGNCVTMRRLYGAENTTHTDDYVVFPCSDEFRALCQKDATGKMEYVEDDDNLIENKQYRVVSNVTLTCPEGWDHYDAGMSCFKVFGTSVSRDTASAICRDEYGGHLAKIPDYFTDRFINSLLSQAGPFWIGLKVEDPGVYLWEDQSPAGSFMPLTVIQPYKCASFWNSHTPLWTTSVCNFPLPFICQYGGVTEEIFHEVEILGYKIFISNDTVPHSSVQTRCADYQMEEYIPSSNAEFRGLRQWMLTNSQRYSRNVWLKTNKESWSTYTWKTDIILWDEMVWYNNQTGYPCYQNYSLNHCCTMISPSTDFYLMEHDCNDDVGLFMCVGDPQPLSSSMETTSTESIIAPSTVTVTIATPSAVAETIIATSASAETIIESSMRPETNIISSAAQSMISTTEIPVTHFKSIVSETVIADSTVSFPTVSKISELSSSSSSSSLSLFTQIPSYPPENDLQSSSVYDSAPGKTNPNQILPTLSISTYQSSILSLSSTSGPIIQAESSIAPTPTGLLTQEEMSELKEEISFLKNLSSVSSTVAPHSNEGNTNTTQKSPIYKLCPCACTNRTINFNPSPKELELMLTKLQKELEVEKTSLSAVVNKKKSAEDERSSSQGIGVMAVICATVPILAIFSVDLIRVYELVRRRYYVL